MWVLILVLVVGGVALWRWRHPRQSGWWVETVGARRAWAYRAVGLEPSFGALQRAVMAEAIRQRTVSVTGAVWLPASLEVDLAAADHEVISHAAVPFLQDIAEVLTDVARTREWRLDGPVRLAFAAACSASPGLPAVRVRSVSGEGPGATPGGPPRSAAPPLPATSRQPEPPRPVPAPAPTRGPREVPGTGTVPATELVGATVPATELVGHPGGPELRLEPDGDDGAPIVLDTDEDAVIGRARPADIVVADPTVSARHCRVHRSGTSWWIEDLGSSNGTVVNGQRLAHRHELASGDVVTLGRRTRFNVRI